MNHASQSLLKIVFPLLVLAFALPIQNAAQAQSASGGDLPEAVAGDAIQAPANTPLGAPALQPTDLIGNIWKHADSSNKISNDKSDYAPSAPSVPVSDRVTAK